MGRPALLIAGAGREHAIAGKTLLIVAEAAYVYANQQAMLVYASARLCSLWLVAMVRAITSLIGHATTVSDLVA